MEEAPATVGSVDPRLEALARIGTVFTWSATVDAQIDFVNDAWLTFRGRTLDEECGEGWLEDVHPDDLPGLRELIAAAYASRDPFEHEYRIRDRERRYRWILDRGEPWYDSSGAFAGFHGTALDIDARVRAEQTANLLSEVGRLVAGGEDPAATLEAVARASIPVLGDVCVIDLVTPEGAVPVMVIDTLGERDLDELGGARSRAGLAWRMRRVERDNLLDRLAGLGCPIVPWRGPGTVDDVLHRLARRAQQPRVRAR